MNEASGMLYLGTDQQRQTASAVGHTGEEPHRVRQLFQGHLCLEGPSFCHTELLLSFLLNSKSHHETYNQGSSGL